VAIATLLAEDDELAAVLTCRRLREAVAGTKRRAAGARLSTRIGSAFCSLGKLEWAMASCGLPLSGGLLLRAAWAAGRGRLHVLQWARANGCRWDAQACADAAWGGHLAVLQWLHANGCPWDEWTCANAAQGGHLGVLQWLRANGRPWDARVCAKAAKDGHMAVLHWALANGCPED
jgi:hypothetical protein